MGNQSHNHGVSIHGRSGEYLAAAAVHAAKTALWLRRMCAQLCGTSPTTITMLEDNKACIQMINNPVVSARNHHFAMRMWWLREQVNNNLIHVQYVPAEQQLADILTKVLPLPRFTELRGHIMKAIAFKRV